MAGQINDKMNVSPWWFHSTYFHTVIPCRGICLLHECYFSHYIAGAYGVSGRCWMNGRPHPVRDWLRTCEWVVSFHDYEEPRGGRVGIYGWGSTINASWFNRTAFHDSTFTNGKSSTHPPWRHWRPSSKTMGNGPAEQICWLWIWQGWAFMCLSWPWATLFQLTSLYLLKIIL